MKKFLAIILAAAMATVSLCACSEPDEFSGKEDLTKDYTRNTDPTYSYNYADGADSTPLSYATYASSISNFELRYFRNYYSQNHSDGKSFVFAPSSAVLQLSLLSNGAGGDTQNEISVALGKDLTLDDLNECSSYFKSRLEEVGKTEKNEKDSLSGKEIENTNSEFVRFENSFFFNDKADTRSSFLQTNANFYSSGIYRFLFDDDNALSKVNKLFSDFTDKNAVSKLNSSDYAISVTASDIADLWLEAYSQSDIEEGKFNADSGERNVNYLTSNETKLKSERAAGAIKYTKNTPLKLMLVMPNENISIDEYVSDFDYLEFSTLLESFDITQKTTVKIPEFSIDGGTTTESVSSVLQNCGLPTLFTDDADFSNLTRTEDFKLNEMYQITPQISLTAKGIGGLTNNDSVTLSENRVKELEKTDETIKFDRPFIFLLLDNESDIPVYMGVVNN